MYEVPSRGDIKRITVTADTIAGTQEPELEFRAEVPPVFTEKSA